MRPSGERPRVFRVQDLIILEVDVVEGFRVQVGACLHLLDVVLSQAAEKTNGLGDLPIIVLNVEVQEQLQRLMNICVPLIEACTETPAGKGEPALGG